MFVVLIVAWSLLPLQPSEAEIPLNAISGIRACFEDAVTRMADGDSLPAALEGWPPEAMPTALRRLNDSVLHIQLDNASWSQEELSAEVIRVGEIYNAVLWELQHEGTNRHVAARAGPDSVDSGPDHVNDLHGMTHSSNTRDTLGRPSREVKAVEKRSRLDEEKQPPRGQKGLTRASKESACRKSEIGGKMLKDTKDVPVHIAEDDGYETDVMDAEAVDSAKALLISRFLT